MPLPRMEEPTVSKPLTGATRFHFSWSTTPAVILSACATVKKLATSNQLREKWQGEILPKARDDSATRSDDGQAPCDTLSRIGYRL
jgi:hypothetical protein